MGVETLGPQSQIRSKADATRWKPAGLWPCTGPVAPCDDGPAGTVATADMLARWAVGFLFFSSGGPWGPTNTPASRD